MFTPYPYQVECLQKMEEAHEEGQGRALMVMASGLGKTVTVALEVQRWLRTHGGRVLYLSHQNDILDQARVTFEAVLGRECTYAYFHGEQKDRNRHSATCLFSSFQTMREQRNGFQPKEFSYVVVDESHHGPAPTYRPTLEYFQPDFLLGITATPERTDLQDIRGIYGQEVYSLSLEDALAQDLLTRVDYRLMTDDIQNLDALDTPVGRMSIGYLNKKLFIPRRDEEIAHIITRHMAEISNPRVMVFCPSVTHCDRLVAFLPSSLPIHYKLSNREQDLRLKAFRNGLVNIVLTVDKFNEGIDVPDANMIVFLRSTSSRMLFLQQLGRGLRKASGKKRVLILDFVGNCERLEMVHKVWEAVGEKRGSYSKKRKKLIPFNVDFGRVKFTEVARRVLDIITAIKTGYAKEVLIKQLRDLSKELGRVPSWRNLKEAHKGGKCASANTFLYRFGSLKLALEAAGMRSRRYQPPSMEQELIEKVKKLADELGRIPLERDIRKASKEGKCPSMKTIARRFGYLGAFLKAAGLTAQRPLYIFGEEEVIQQLQKIARELGRSPTKEEVNKASQEGKAPSATTCSQRFGSFNAALRAAGLAVRHRRTGGRPYSDKELIKQLRKLRRQLGRAPSRKDVANASKAGKCAAVATFREHFGSLPAAFMAAGL